MTDPKPKAKKEYKEPVHTWKPLKPGFEVNELGQFRTVGHEPGNVPTLPITKKA